MKVYLDKSKIKQAGRGVFALADFKKDSVIETCPVIVVDSKDAKLLRKTELVNYYFIWENGVAICLGLGSLYNHSYQPNATYRKNIKKKTIEFISLKAIKIGEEITVNYNYGNPSNKATLWIKSIKPFLS